MPKKNDTIIRVIAKCQLFEIDKQIPEKKIIAELTTIRKSFEKNNWFRFKGKDKLIVTTSVVNPTLI